MSHQIRCRKLEQICPGEKQRTRKYLKRAAHRLWRRLWREYGEDAPKRAFWRGYSI